MMIIINLLSFALSVPSSERDYKEEVKVNLCFMYQKFSTLGNICVNNKN
jgi:hypothetical protein